MVINLAQKSLEKQFPAISGLHSSILQAKKQNDVGGQQCSRYYTQIIDLRSNDWIDASNVHLEESDKVMVYDSLYDSTDDRTQVIIHELFGVSIKHNVAKVHKQQGIQECGLFAIAFTTVICFGQDLYKPLHQKAIHLYLGQCFERDICLPFPTVHQFLNCCNNTLVTRQVVCEIFTLYTYGYDAICNCIHSILELSRIVYIVLWFSGIIKLCRVFFKGA